MSIPVFFQSISDLISGTLIYYVRLANGFSILPIFPILTTMYSLWIKETRFIRIMNLIAWILAFISTLTVFILTMRTINSQVFWLWGLWLYIILAVSAIILEITVMKNIPNEKYK